jgi:hypothetical protein
VLNKIRKNYLVVNNILLPEGPDELLVVLDDAEDVTVEEDGEDPLVGDLLPGEQEQVLHSGVQGQPHNRRLVYLNNQQSVKGQKETSQVQEALSVEGPRGWGTLPPSLPLSLSQVVNYMERNLPNSPSPTHPAT